MREALLNAICHKQYQSGIPIQISVYKDRLYAADAGYLPEEGTIESLMSRHSSGPYNPDIAYVFCLAGFIESWDRGVEKICHPLKADRLPMPEYLIHPEDIMIKFTKPADWDGSTSDKVIEEVTDKVQKVPDREKEGMQLLSENPNQTTSFLAEAAGISRKTISKYLKSLREKGCIERIGSDRSGHWKVIR